MKNSCEEIYVVFGKKVQEVRISKNLSVDDLAIRTNIKVAEIIRIEAGEAVVRLLTLDAIARGLELPVSELCIF